MRNLLAANLRALFKSRAFWTALAGTALFSVYIVTSNDLPEMQNPIYLDEVCFSAYLLAGVILAATISLVIGAEHSDGVIRNKLATGRSRHEVYFAALATSLIATLLAAAVHGAITFSLGSLLLGPIQISIRQLITLEGLALLNALALAALFTAVAMNCPNKAVCGVASLLLAFFLIIAANTIRGKLQEPEMNYDSIVITEEGIQYGNLVPNPAYVSESQRPFYEFLCDFLPDGQIAQIHTEDLTRIKRWPAFSASFLILSAGAGYAVFRRKDLR